MTTVNKYSKIFRNVNNYEQIFIEEMLTTVEKNGHKPVPNFKKF